MKTTLLTQTRQLLVLLTSWLWLAAAPTLAQDLKLVLPVGGRCADGAFSPDGQVVATANETGSVGIWDAWAGTLLQELTPRPAAHLAVAGVTRVAFSADGSQVAAVVKYASPAARPLFGLIVWQMPAGKVLFELPRQADEPAVQFSPVGLLLLTQSAHANDSRPTVWEPTSHRRLARLPAAENYVRFSPDGSRLASVVEKDIHLWDAHTGKLLLSLATEDKVAIYKGCFSPDGKKLLAAAGHRVGVWDLTTGAASVTMEHLGELMARGTLGSMGFSPDGGQVVATCSWLLLGRWDAATGRLLAWHGQPVKIDYSSYVAGRFTPNCQLLVQQASRYDLTVWNVAADPPGRQPLYRIERNYLQGWWLSPDGQRLALHYWDYNQGTRICLVNTRTGVQQTDLHGYTRRTAERLVSADGQTAALLGRGGDLSLWHVPTGTWQSLRDGVLGQQVRAISFSADGRYLMGVLADKQSAFLTWEVSSGKLVRQVAAARPIVVGFREKWCYFNQDNSRMLLVNLIPDSVSIWDTSTGQRLGGFRQRSFLYHSQPIWTTRKRRLRRVKRERHRRLLGRLSHTHDEVQRACFSPDGQRVLAFDYKWRGDFKSRVLDASMQVLDARTGAIMANLTHPRLLRSRHWELAAALSPDGRQVLSSNGSRLDRWDAATGQLMAGPETSPRFDELLTPNGDPGRRQTLFSPDSRWLLSFSPQAAAPACVWNTVTGATVPLSRAGRVLAAGFGPGGATIITASADSVLRVWDTGTGRLLRQLTHFPVSSQVNFSVDAELRYVLFWVDGENEEALRCRWFDHPADVCTLLLLDDGYLVYDQHFRYDGTSAARNLLSLNCGGEAVGLNQFKELLWVQDLAGRLDRGEAIGNATIRQLGVCGLTPEVELLASSAAEGYRYRIRPRRGGLGEVALSVNGIELRRYRPAQLQRVGADYELRVPPDTLAGSLVPGQANPVVVRAYTADNAVASRGTVLVAQPAGQAAPANLYALVVGVSDYQGDGLDLQFAAKDAHDLGRALAASARRLLNQDGREHVFVRELLAEKGSTARPEKAVIQAALASISERAVASDIVLLFFAGHGTVASPDKRFYFLTADATPVLAADAATLPAVGISTQELAEWLRPNRLRAQKRVLIFDACQSGQAINDLLQLGSGAGGGQPYVGVRNDEDGQRLHALEKLNEKAGLVILAAAGSTQSAIEAGRYQQGLLTYSLLRAIKEQPEILNGQRFLYLADWFGAAEKGVPELARAGGRHQEPQQVGTTNFPIGEVDEEVRRGIVLRQTRMIFIASNFQNADALDDDLELGALLNQHLQRLGDQTGDAPLSYAGAVALPDAFSLLGRYTVQAGTVRVSISLRRGHQQLKQFEVSGPATELNQLAGRVAAEAVSQAAQAR